MTSYAMYLETKDTKVSDILDAHFKKYGQPPQPIELLVNAKVDTESIPLPEGLAFVIKAERCILPRHILVELQKEVDNGHNIPCE